MDSETRVKSILFPTEVLLCILHHCNYRSILRFSTTCKNAYEIVRQSISLQLHIELEVNGLEIANIDRSSDRSHDYASILEELKDYRDAWLNFRLGPETLKQVRKPTGYNPRYELNNETYFRAFHQLVHDEDNGSEGGPTSDYIQVVKFNSLVHSPLLKFKSIHEFAVDSNGDLIVLVEYDKEYERYRERFTYITFRRVHLHLRHITTGESHSLARFPIITVQLRSLDDQPWGFTRGCPIIMKDLLVVHFVRRILIGDPSLRGDPSTDGEILIWNWRSGALLGRINCGTERAKSVFLDESHLVVYSPFPHLNTESEVVGLNQVALFVYRVPNAPASHEEIITSHIHVPSYTVLDPILIFELPKLHAAYEIFSYDLGKSLALPGDLAYKSDVADE
ncbi:hypothetical protein RSOLAG1IB_08401 [Rhizoctonia solani AG-1 IB]|uniref:F-box domain-containing protein n=1 Tax=Thanatephorus cucumeris (strain AG1-IB / isolate 7/3/14) TaxID=1108050 RepID=A0A0B7FLT6_THACB|nr:hypothetical protein RSOLAG1IB_08401 [Rhizoctonia solani AG-1 IB]